MTSALVVMVAGIVSRAGPESCMTLSSSRTSTVFVGLLWWLPGIRGSTGWVDVLLFVVLSVLGAGVELLMSSDSVSSRVMYSCGS